jgi:hypothetical protein
LNATEAEVLAIQTQAFIDASPTEVTIMREQTVEDGAGGKRPIDPLEIPQVVKVATQPAQRFVVTEDGRNVPVNKSLVGMPDFDVRVGDTFELEGEGVFEVLGVRQPLWAVVADAVKRGV